MYDGAPAPPLPAASPAAGQPRRLGWLLAVVLTGQFMAILDVSIVNVAAPTIRADLRSSGSALQLIIAGYTIGYAVLLVTGARLGNRYGLRSMFHCGLALFTVASLACGLAGSTGQLIGFRFVQGAGAALMVPQVLSLIQRNFPGPARAKALSTLSAVIACGAVAGQIAGGLLVGADLFGSGWRPVFLVNVPIGLVLLAVSRRLLPADQGTRGGGLDIPGLATFSPAVLFLVLPLVLGHQQDWPLWGWLCLAGSVVVFVGFLFTERAVTRRGGSPLFPADVVRAPGMIPAAVAIGLSMATYAGYLFSAAVHLQSGLGHSPLEAGLLFIPGGVGFAVGSLNWRQVPERWQHAMSPVGLLVVGLTYAGMGMAFSSGDRVGWIVCLLFGVMGLGFGAAFSPLMTRALSYVPLADAPHASGLLSTVVQLGQVIGVATFGTLYLSLLPSSGSAGAVATTDVALAIVVVLSAVAAARLPRPALTPRT